MTQFLTAKAVCERIALSRSTLDRLVATDKFPQPIKLTERRIAFNAQDVEGWMSERLERA
jgi:predicted DNA-binding transcriptional regulator AlpA